MKKIIIFTVLFWVSSQLIGQDKNQLNTMIISSINSYITNDKDLVRRGISLRDTSYYYICMDGLPVRCPIDSVKNVTFFSLINIVGLPNSFKNKLNKGMKALFISTNLSQNQLIITVAGRGVKRINSNNISIVVGDWGVYTYEYSCDEQKWVLTKTEYGGI